MHSVLKLLNRIAFNKYNLIKVNQRHRSLIRSVSTSNACTTDANHSDDSSVTNKTVLPSINTKFKPFSDEDSEVIFDVNEELMREKANEDYDDDEQGFYIYQKKKRKVVRKVDASRGVTGVFDIHQLVELLRAENMRDIAVIEVPQRLEYARYLVLSTATSLRHMKAFVEFFNKLYKQKKSKSDPFLDFGKDMCDEWKVVDMKNIVLHLFMKETRDYYDIETLWTVGEEYDDKTQRPEFNEVFDIIERHTKFLQETQTAI